jgi:hypothetical protein
MSRAALAVLIGIAVISMSDLPGLKAQGNSGVALSNGGEGWEASAAIGSTVDNSWGNAVNVSAGDSWPSVPVFALGTGGHGVLLWAFTGSFATAEPSEAERRRPTKTESGDCDARLADCGAKADSQPANDSSSTR